MTVIDDNNNNNNKGDHTGPQMPDLTCTSLDPGAPKSVDKQTRKPRFTLVIH